MPCILSLPTKDCHRRLYEARERADQAASGQRKEEVADSDLTIAYAGTCWQYRKTTEIRDSWGAVDGAHPSSYSSGSELRDMLIIDSLAESHWQTIGFGVHLSVP